MPRLVSIPTETPVSRSDDGSWIAAVEILESPQPWGDTTALNRLIVKGVGASPGAAPAREPPRSWRANDAAVVTCKPLTVDCGGFGLQRSFATVLRAA